MHVLDVVVRVGDRIVRLKGQVVGEVFVHTEVLFKCVDICGKVYKRLSKTISMTGQVCCFKVFACFCKVSFLLSKHTTRKQFGMTKKLVTCAYKILDWFVILCFSLSL